mmetsp:Transcript_56176/g.114421  ORF Transcript_56176/g.114421 Transcript_56176/m.114421 type:complete len:314 (+) Transcript_56176:128-1069(+)
MPALAFLCKKRPLSLLLFHGFNQLTLATHSNDLLKDEEDDQDVAKRVFLQVLFHDAHHLLHLGCCHCSNGQTDAHDDGTNRCASNELCWLEEVSEGLLAIWRLQAVAPQFVARSRQNTCCHNSGKHVHNPAHHGAREGGIQVGEENGDLVASNAIDNVSQNCWAICLVEVSRGHGQVHGLSEAVVGDWQGDCAKDRSQCCSSCGGRKIYSLHDDVGGLKEWELDEVRRQGGLQELLDHLRIQSLHSLHQGYSLHQHVVHQRLRHRTQRSCHHSTHCSLGSSTNHAANKILLRHGWVLATGNVFYNYVARTKIS